MNLQLDDTVKTVKNEANSKRVKEFEGFPEAPATGKIIGIGENTYDVIFGDPLAGGVFVYELGKDDVEFVAHEIKG